MHITALFTQSDTQTPPCQKFPGFLCKAVVESQNTAIGSLRFNHWQLSGASAEKMWFLKFLYLVYIVPGPCQPLVHPPDHICYPPEPLVRRRCPENCIKKIVYKTNILGCVVFLVT
jgi:hypothetical protein